MFFSNIFSTSCQVRRPTRFRLLNLSFFFFLRIYYYCFRYIEFVSLCVCVCVLINCRKPVVQCYVISLTQDVSWFILYVHFLLLEIRRRIEEKKKKKHRNRVTASRQEMNPMFVPVFFLFFCTTTVLYIHIVQVYTHVAPTGGCLKDRSFSSSYIRATRESASLPLLLHINNKLIELARAAGMITRPCPSICFSLPFPFFFFVISSRRAVQAAVGATLFL